MVHVKQLDILDSEYQDKFKNCVSVYQLYGSPSMNREDIHSDAKSKVPQESVVHVSSPRHPQTANKTLHLTVLLQG